MDRSNSNTFKPSSVVGQREVDKATSSIEPKNLQSGLTTTQFKSGTADIVKDNSLALEAKDLMSSLGKELGELKEVHDRRLHTAFKEINSALALLDKIDNPDDHQTFAGSAELSITARKLKLLVKLLDNKTTHIGKPLPAAPESKHKNDTQLRLKTEGTLKDLLTSLSDVIDQRILAETNLNNIIIKPANSMLLKGLAPGKPLADQIASCQEKIDSCEKAIKDFEANVKLVKEKGTSPGISSIADLSTLHGLQSQINCHESKATPRMMKET